MEIISKLKDNEIFVYIIEHKSKEYRIIIEGDKVHIHRTCDGAPHYLFKIENQELRLYHTFGNLDFHDEEGIKKLSEESQIIILHSLDNIKEMIYSLAEHVHHLNLKSPRKLGFQGEENARGEL